MSIAICDIRNGRDFVSRNTILRMSGYPWLQKRIYDLKISQAEAARRCDIDPVYFNKMIKGREKRGMSAIEALRISRALNMPIEEVITGSIEQNNEEELGWKEEASIIRNQLSQLTDMVAKRTIVPENASISHKPHNKG